MFKSASAADELLQSMEKNLVGNQVETKYGFSKLAKAADLLNTAASIFEQAGMHEEAEGVTQVLQDLAQDLKRKQ